MTNREYIDWLDQQIEIARRDHNMTALRERLDEKEQLINGITAKGAR